jgi:hypothetical protein
MKAQEKNQVTISLCAYFTIQLQISTRLKLRTVKSVAQIMLQMQKNSLEQTMFWKVKNKIH